MKNNERNFFTFDQLGDFIMGKKPKSTCSDFAEQLFNEGFWSEIFSEMYWTDSFSSKICLEIFINEANVSNIELTDINEWDYDTEFYESYKADSDKGLN